MQTRVGLVIALLILSTMGSSRENVTSNSPTLEGFNRKFEECILNTDHAGMLAMWAEDGVDLMPGEALLVGRTQ